MNKNEETRNLRLREIHESIAPLNPKTGAPRLLNLKCAYPECGREFKSISLFKRHLKEAFGTTPDTAIFSMAEMHRMGAGCASTFDFFITDHPLFEDFPNFQKLKISPILFQENDIIKCPIPQCKRANNFKTPEELCDHFAYYGVKPFWFPGWKPLITITKTNVIIEEEEEEQKIKSARSPWDNPGQCTVCLDEMCNHIIVPCGHVNMCTECYVEWNQLNGTCPTCRVRMTGTIPLMSFNAKKDEISVFFVA